MSYFAKRRLELKIPLSEMDGKGNTCFTFTDYSNPSSQSPSFYAQAIDY